MKNKTPLLKRDGVQSLIASLICVILGVFIGYIVLLIINPAGARQDRAADHVLAVDPVCI